MNKSLNIKYALSQIFYYAALSSILGFSAVFLLDKGFSNSSIGLILALANVIAAFFQPAIAVVFDKTTKTKMNESLRIMILISIVLSLLIYFVDFSQMILGIIFTFILSLIVILMPFMNSLAFIYEDYGYKVNFGFARGLGSVGYAVISVILGFILKTVDSSILLLSYTLFCILLYLVILFYKIDEPEKVISNKKEEVKNLTMLEFIKKYKLFVIFLIGGVCAFFSHSLTNNFYIQVINNVNGNSSDMGNAIFISAMVELPIMALFEKINKKFSSVFLLKFSMFFFFIKHVLTYLASNVTMIYIASFFQIFSYALFIPAAVYYVNTYINEKDRVKGQSLVTLCTTIGAVLSSFFGGILLDMVGVGFSLLVSAIISLIGFIISLVSIKK